MSTSQFLLSAWKWDAFASAVVLGITLLRFAAVRQRSAPGTASPLSLLRAPARRNVAFAAGLICLILALCSPVRVLADSYLFSAHMLQHLLLLIVVPPLLLSSLPPTSSPPPSNGGRRARTRLPVPLSWLAGVGAMWLWHAPTLCNAATSSQTVFHLQLVSLLLFGTVFWLPVYGPRLEQRLPPLSGIAYLFSACLGCTLLGIYITFTPLTVCSIYAHPTDPLGILPLIRRDWELSPAADQRLGGLMMWVPACLIYLAGILSLLARWYSDNEAGAPAVTGTMKPKHI